MQTTLYGLVDSIPNSKGFGELFYVGVGPEKRMRSHWRLGRKGMHYNSLVQDVFNEHKAHDVVPGHRVLAICPSHEYAFAAERKAIQVYGRKRLGLGFLCNVSAGGDGPDAELMKDPEIVAKLRSASNKNWADPAYRVKRADSIRTVVVSEEFKTAVSEQTKKALNDPEVRERHLAGLVRANAAQTKERRAAAQVTSYEENPERRIKVSVWAKIHNALPEIKERKSKASTAANLINWQDPSIREKRIAGMRGKKKTLSAAALEARRLNAQKRRRNTQQ